jgi:uncharacterized integral membrane protein
MAAGRLGKWTPKTYARGGFMAAEPVQTDSRRLSGGVIATLIGLAILLIFIFQNTEVIQFRFLFLRFEWPLWLYTIATAVVGALVWFGLGVVRRHRRRQERRLDRR